MKRYASVAMSIALLWSVLFACGVESQDSAIEQWRAYERELKAWCATTAPSAQEDCVREELQRKGFSPTLFDTPLPPQTPESRTMPPQGNDLDELSNKLHRKESQQKNEVRSKEEDSSSPIVVIPGKSVGKFSLGMRREDMLKIAPKPQENTPNRLVYKNKKTGNILIAHFEKDKIVQIDFTSKNFYTAEGIHVGNFQDVKYAGLFVVWRLPGTSEALKLTLKAGGLTFYSPSAGLLGPDASSLALGVVHEGQNLIYELRGIEGKENGGWIKESVVESSRYVPDLSSQPALSTPPRPSEPKVDYSPSGRGMETTGSLLQGLLLLLFGLALYFLPTIIASWSPRHHNAGAIFVLNLFLGWTFIGWVVALVWACTHSRPQANMTTSLFLSLFLLAIVIFVIATQLTIFVVQPIGAIPEGRMLVLWRGQKMQFIDSADALCAREMGGVSLLCRMMVLGKIVEVNTIFLRLPYSDTLYLWSTGGARYDR